MNAPALEIHNLHAWNGGSQVLRDVNLKAQQGEAITLLGGTDTERTALLQALLGQPQTRTGSVRIHGTESIQLPENKITQLGLAYCSPQSGIFSGLSCEENLLLPSSPENTLGGGMSLAEIYEIFPALSQGRHLPGSRLSGGEQRMLAIARILRTGADVLLLNEICAGQAPVIVHALTQTIEVLKKKEYCILLLEQSFDFATDIVDLFYVMEHGTIAETFSHSQLAARQTVLTTLLSA